MPGPLQQRPIKGLNKGPGKKRFVFKSFSQRIEEVDLDVFRSLAPVKLEPTGGTSFFHESLVAWRELNSAMEFTLIYEVLLPIVQTLPQLILHKKLIMGTLLSHLHFSAIHSLEPILSLIAILSRDLRSDFISFIPQFLGACVDLFQSGGDREPDIIEQVFTALSYIFKYMQKLLCKDISSVLKATKRLRYYRRLHIQDFAAEAVSYLLRNSSLKQLIKGIRRLFTEVVSKPSKENINSCSSLLWYTLKGPGAALHSRAEPVLRLLLDNSTFRTARKEDPGSQVIVEVLSETFCRLGEELDRTKLSLLWVCLLDELNSLLDLEESSALRCKHLSCSALNHDILRNGAPKTMENKDNDSVGDKVSEGMDGLNKREDAQQEEDKKLNIANLLSLLNALLEFRKGSQVYDFEPLFKLSHRLLQSYFLSLGEETEPSRVSLGFAAPANAGISQLSFQILRLILALIKSHSEVTGASIGPSAIVSHARSWTLLWNCSDYLSLLYFVRGLLEQDNVIIQPFLPYLLRTFDGFIYTHSVDILPLMMDLFEKIGKTAESLLFQESQLQRLVSFVVSTIEDATKRLNGELFDSTSIVESTEPAFIWAALKCYSHLVQSEKCDRFLAWNYVLALDHWLSTAKACIETKEEHTRKLWEFILAAALSCELKVLSQLAEVDLSSRASDFLKLVVRYKDSPHVLKSVADFLDLFRDSHAINKAGIVPVELQENQVLSLFENNLGSHSKLLRLSTLRLLIHFESISIFSPRDDSADPKRRKGIDGRPCKPSITISDSIFEQFRSLEAAPFSLEVGRQSSLLLTRLKVKACAGNLPEDYMVPLMHAMVGMLSNRFKLLWDATIDCLAGLLEMQRMPVWETFVRHLGFCQSLFLSREVKLHAVKGIDAQDAATEGVSSRLEHCRHDKVESTDAGTLVTLLLRAAQKVPKIVEGRTRQLIPLFLTFVGHSAHGSERLSVQANRGKEWKVVLKEWLILLGMMKNAQSYFKSSAVKEIIVNRFLMDGDPDIQLKALECVLNWKDNYLTPYEEHLRNLISQKVTREEMTTWNIGKESDQVQLNDREGLVPIIMRLLFPKILKTKTRLHNKTAGGVQRKVVLSFLAHLDVQELAFFFILILKPLESAFTQDGVELTHGGCAWESAIKQGVKSSFIEWVDSKSIADLSYKKKTGFLHMVKDMLETFDKDHVTPYLHAFLAFSFRILQACQVTTGEDTLASTPKAADLAAFSGTKDLRTLVFKVLAIVFSKYDDLEFRPAYWDIFFGIVRPMIMRFREEGASGDSPSALFSCFLAMSRSLVLISVLRREEELVPNLVPLLSHKNASTSIVGAALSFIENILELDDEDTPLVVGVFLPHLPVLLSNIRALLSSQKRVASGRKFSSSVKRGLQVLIQISKHISSPADAIQLLDVLLPFLSPQKKASQEEIVNVLRVLKELAPSFNVESCEKTFPFLGQMLSSNPLSDVRSAVCQVLSALSMADSAICSVAGLISDLNAISTSTVGEYDYERRLQAYVRPSGQFFGQLTYNQALLVISQAIYDVKSDDISIRHSASNCLSAFIHFLASICVVHQNGVEGNNTSTGTSLTMVNSMATCFDDGNLSACWDLESVKLAVQKLLLPNIRRSMGLESLTVRREWAVLLREMVSNLHVIPPLSELLPLMNSDTEVDFFNNINHIQTHRRIRAMSRFKELCSASKFSQGTLVRIFEPLFTNSLYEGKGDKDGNLVQSAVEVLACIAAQLQWDPYYSLLMRLFRMITSHPEHEKLMIRLLCSILDKFHFQKASLSCEGSQEMVEVEKVSAEQDLCLEPDDEELGWRSVTTDLDGKANADSYIPEEIQRQLQVRVLPEFIKLMVSKANIINVPVALAVVKVLQLMPKEVMELELPRIIQSIVNLLKNRSQAVRDEARVGLLAVVGFLGAGYVGFVVEKLQGSLKRGYEVHVLGFTLNALVAKVFPKLKVGEIDYCAERVINLLGIDIFEDVAEEKEVEKIAFKMKETKRTGSYESVKLVAQMVTFQLHGATLLKSVKGRLKDALVPKTKVKIERVLRQLALGIQLNQSLKQEELLVFVHGLVEDGIMNEKSRIKVSRSDVKSKSAVQQASTSDEGKEIGLNQYLITEFALYLLESHLKRAKMNRSDSSLLSMLDPMVLLLRACLESKHGAVLGLALKCLCHLLRLPLPSIGLISKDLITMVLVMAQGIGKAETQVAESCFNVLVALLKHAKGAHVTEEQLRIILQFPVFVDLEIAESNTGLVLLKAILGRKLLVPELYDIINRVSQLMVTSHVAVVRQYCSQIVLQFLLDYPLGSRRLQQHLDFFVTNLSYEHASGREAVLEMLHAIIVKFPVQAIDEQLETLFLPLVTRLVNDDSNQLRAMVGTVLKVLMGRVSQRSAQRMLHFCFSWLNGDKQQLWRAAGQVLGFAIEVMKENFLVHLEETFTSSFVLLNHVLEVNGAEKDATMAVGSVLWQEAYHILTMFEKLLKQFPDVCFRGASEGLWEVICCFLLHHHVWVRKVSCRLLDVYFTARCTGNNMGTASPSASGQQAFLLQPSRLMLLAAVLCQQLDSELDEGLAELIEKNLLFVSSTLHYTFFDAKGRLSWMDLVSGSDAFTQARVAKAMGILKVHLSISSEDKKSGRSADDLTKRNKEVVKRMYDGTTTETKYFGLFPVLKYLEKVSLQANDLQMKTVFHLYESLTTRLGRDGVRPYLSSMLLPLYKTAESVAAKIISDDLKNLAENVLNHLRETIGTVEFVQAYNETRQMTKDVREERRRAKKLKVLVDPEGHARRKLKLNAKRQAQKKKKRTDMRQQSRG